MNVKNNNKIRPHKPKRLTNCLIGEKMNSKPDTLVLLACLVALGALLTGFMTPDVAQTGMIVSENLIR